MNPYTEEAFRALQEGSRRSAEVVVPLVMDLLKPVSVVDLGCGLGTWLAVFAQHGVEVVLGVDGSHVDQNLLKIPASSFRPHDLGQHFSTTQPFDLAISLEIGQHLELKAAPVLVDSLVKLAPTVLFSAAIPMQGGTGHVNEQWPDFWVRLFEEREFVVLDCLRPEIWTNKQVEWWYAQNLLLFVRQDFLAGKARLVTESIRTRRKQISVVHPQRYVNLANQLSQLLRNMPATTSENPGRVFQYDYFSNNIPLWTQFLEPLKGQPVHFVEIGVFEGRSTCWLLDNVLTHPDSRLTWIDPFAYNSEFPECDLTLAEEHFRHNTKSRRGQLIEMKGISQEMLRKLPFASFDFIYIDGSHAAPDVLSDAVLAFPLLKPHGMLAFDDYHWKHFPDPRRNPKLAIDAFCSVFSGQFDLLHRGYQVWLRKK